MGNPEKLYYILTFIACLNIPIILILVGNALIYKIALDGIAAVVLFGLSLVEAHFFEELLRERGIIHK